MDELRGQTEDTDFAAVGLDGSRARADRIVSLSFRVMIRRTASIVAALTGAAFLLAAAPVLRPDDAHVQPDHQGRRARSWGPPLPVSLIVIPGP